MRDSRTDKQKVIDGFRLAGIMLLGFAVLCCILGGAFTLVSGEGRFSRPVAGFLCVVGLVVAGLAVNRWRKWFGAFFFAPGILAAVLWMITGRLRSGRPIARMEALDYFLIFAISTALASHYARRKSLSRLETIALVAALAGWAFMAAAESVVFGAMMVFALGLPLLVNNFPRRRRKLMADG